MSDSVKRKIKKLFTLAENEAATEGEAHNSMALLNKLLRENNLSMSDIDFSEEKVTHNFEEGKSTGAEKKKFSAWEKCTASAVGILTETISVTQIGHRQKIYFIGHKEDAFAASVMYAYLIKVARSTCYEKFGKRVASYMNGFSHGLHAKAREIKKGEKEATTKTNLPAIIEAKKNWLEEITADKGFAKSKPRKVSAGNGYSQGYAQGKNTPTTGIDR